MNFKVITTFFTFLIWTTGCVDREIDYEIPFEGPRLAALALLENNQVAEVRLHRTFDPAIPTPHISVLNANVILFADNQLIEVLEYVATEDEYEQGSLYRSAGPVQFQPGRDYFLTARVEGLPTLESEAVQLPELTTVESLSPLDFNLIAGTPFSAQTTLQLSQLSPSEGYFFELTADYIDTTGVLEDLTGISTFLHYSPPFSEERTPSGRLNLLMVLPLLKTLPDTSTHFYATGTLLLSVHHFSAVYASYFDQVVEGAFEGELGGFFSTFYNYPNNFTGGYGIFGISNSIVIPIVI